MRLGTKIPLKQTYTKQELSKALGICLQDCYPGGCYTTMKAFPSPSLYPIARDSWIQVYTQLLEIPQFLPTRWLGTGAGIWGVSIAIISSTLNSSKKGWDRALLRELSFLERNTEVMILPFASRPIPRFLPNNRTRKSPP